MNAGMYSSQTCEWETPQELFDRLDAIYHFETDVCATAENAKCVKYYTKEQDGLTRE
jgi:site-specific DNA-methyltransferase (adenine-specific)